MQFVNECINCLHAKMQHHTKSYVESISAPADRFQTVHIDVVGPLPLAAIPSQNQSLPFRCLLTSAHRATCWAEAIPINDHLEVILERTSLDYNIGKNIVLTIMYK